MKKFILITLVFMLSFSVVACNVAVKNEATDDDNTNKMPSSDYISGDVGDVADIEINDGSDDSDALPEFIPPAEVYSGITPNFVYDEKGRISVCYYNINGEEVYQSYIYSDLTVEIYTFYGDAVIDVVEFPYTADDENADLTEQDGYYFKGIRLDDNSDVNSHDDGISDFGDMISEEEAVALVRDLVGEGYGLLSEGIVDRNGELYYSIRMTWLVDEYHSSTINQYLVKVDGSEILDYFE